MTTASTTRRPLDGAMNPLTRHREDFPSAPSAGDRRETEMSSCARLAESGHACCSRTRINNCCGKWGSHDDTKKQVPPLQWNTTRLVRDESRGCCVRRRCSELGISGRRSGEMHETGLWLLALVATALARRSSSEGYDELK
jgi:hypothetical protein